MRATLAVILLGVLAAACGADRSGDPSPPPPGSGDPTPAPSADRSPVPACPPKAVPVVVTIVFAKNPDHPTKDTCDLMEVNPVNVEVCAGDEIRWDSVNKCQLEEVKVHIGERKRLFPSGTTTDPFPGKGSLPKDPLTIPTVVNTPSPFPFATGIVDGNTQEAHYKYAIQGTIKGVVFAIDPEIDVRRDTRRKETPMPSPTASPSPAGSR